MKDRNENRPGYKETKVGWIPEEWKYQFLGDLATIKDGTHFTPQYTESGVPFLRVTDIVQNHKNTGKKYISEEEHATLTKRVTPEKGDVLYSKNGTIGVARLVDWDWKFSIFVSLALLKIKDPNISGNYLEIWLNSWLAKREIYRGSKQSSVTNLHLEEINKFRTGLPSLPEQEKIAEVLGCWDEGIGRLEKLIEQKRLRKKGLMQQLLIGKKRLPGFSEDWKEVQLGKILKRTEPYEKLEAGKSYPLVSIRRHAGGIFDRGRIPREEISYVELARLQRHNFLISKRQVSHGAYGLVSDKHVGCYVSAEYVILEPITNNLHMPFLEWLSKERIMWHKGYVSSDGVHLEKLILDPKHFLKHTIPLPPLEEQKAIATVLRTADEEIQLLEDELDALREQKKGLMQKLLTGEVRCPDFRHVA